MRGVRRKDACRMPDGRIRSAGWTADIHRMGLAYRTSFADTAHGGREGALAAALAWRRESLRRLRLGLDPTRVQGRPYLARKRELRAKRRAAA